MPRHQVTAEELRQQLRDQIAFLRTSCRLYDEGEFHEAKRIATSARILLHDTERSSSLLRQLAHKNILQFISRALPYNPRNVMPYLGLLNIQMGNPPVYLPKMETQESIRMTFETWWNQPVLKDADDSLYTRKDLVLFVADKDGGAHVDPEMDAAYQLLSRENHVGWGVAIGGVRIQWRENPVLPSLRQIGLELSETLNSLPEVNGFEVN